MGEFIIEKRYNMAILSTIKKVMPYLKTATGYVLCRLSSQAVEMDDGTTLQESYDSLNSKTLKTENLDKVFSGGFLNTQEYNFTDGESISDNDLVYVRAGLQDFDLYTDWTSFPAAVGLNTDVTLSYYVNDGAYYSIKVDIASNTVTVKDISRGANWQSVQMYLEIYKL